MGPLTLPHETVWWDPLVDVRDPGWPDIDVFMSGTVFLDIVFTGLPTLPAAGTEVWAGGMASCPGGIANLAIAAARLGLRTSLAAGFGDDVYADFCWRTGCWARRPSGLVASRTGCARCRWRCGWRSVWRRSRRARG